MNESPRAAVRARVITSRHKMRDSFARASGSLFILNLQLRMTREEAAALEFVAAGFERLIFINSSFQVTPVAFFRNFDSKVLAIVFNHGKDERSIWFLFAHKFTGIATHRIDTAIRVCQDDSQRAPGRLAVESCACRYIYLAFDVGDTLIQLY